MWFGSKCVEVAEEVVEGFFDADVDVERDVHGLDLDRLDVDRVVGPDAGRRADAGQDGRGSEDWQECFHVGFLSVELLVCYVLLFELTG